MDPKIYFAIELYTILIFKIKNINCLDINQAYFLALLLISLDWEFSSEEHLKLTYLLNSNISTKDIRNRLKIFCDQIRHDDEKRNKFLMNLAMMNVYLYFYCKELQNDYRELVLVIFNYFGMNNLELNTYEDKAIARLDRLHVLLNAN